MEKFDVSFLKRLYVPSPDSVKGENGKVLIVGGSDLFHSPAFWSFEIASKIVDMVYFSSTPMNNEILKSLKAKFINGIIVPRDKVADYASEADSILIGPGLPRPSGEGKKDDNTKSLTKSLFTKFPDKRWVVDSGSLQVVEPDLIPKSAIITPNVKEFNLLFGENPTEANVEQFAGKYGFTILVKGPVDYVSDVKRTVKIEGGNPGMTKGGTGDVLAGLTASFYAKNEAFLSATAASFINKKAGESLEKKVGNYFNATDLVDEIPVILKDLV